MTVISVRKMQNKNWPLVPRFDQSQNRSLRLQVVILHRQIRQITKNIKLYFYVY